ncbi:uncharacterized protein B0T23DRAFT_394759 [Neurospora hispaniola]|uniref:Uncharacterized protein n=1 Tax=Neurospora hispaniola TaxID=588809 RepID=A0AAJ0I9U7_9PEZI|nr:hypothetical protein B0T23DRAFT_394759 [Neurospora hispaniola]
MTVFLGTITTLPSHVCLGLSVINKNKQKVQDAWISILPKYHMCAVDRIHFPVKDAKTVQPVRDRSGEVDQFGRQYKLTTLAPPSPNTRSHFLAPRSGCEGRGLYVTAPTSMRRHYRNVHHFLTVNISMSTYLILRTGLNSGMGSLVPGLMSHGLE